MTLDQIDEVRQGTQPSFSLRQAYANLVRLGRASGMTYEDCATCKGYGFTKATLLASPKAVQALAKACPKEPVPVQYERCPDCGGAGGFVHESRSLGDPR